MATSAKSMAAPARWQFHAPPGGSDAAVTLLARALNLTPIAARLLVRRGIQSPKDAEGFLSRRFDLMHDPMLLPDIEPAIAAPNLDLLALDDALKTLEGQDQRMASVVKLRFFAGFTIEQTAQMLGVSTSTVENDWAYARCWLRLEMGGSGGAE